MPCVASLAAFHTAVAEFEVEDLGLVIEPAARAAAGRSLDCSGLSLLGEEWPDDLAPVIRGFLAGQPLRLPEGGGIAYLCGRLWQGGDPLHAGLVAAIDDRARAYSICAIPAV